MKVACERKACERCSAEPVAAVGNRYCKECEKIVKLELQNAGYLTPIPRPSYRTSEQMENTYETKHGTGH